jgi:ComF family protein
MAYFSEKTDHALSRLVSMAQMLGQILLPERCCGCGKELVRASDAGQVVFAARARLCGECWSELDFIDAPLCPISGDPFPFADAMQENGEAQAVSAEVLARRPAFTSARAAVRYGAVARRLVGQLKYGDRTDLAPLFASWLMRCGAEVLAEADFVVPVPLHGGRLFLRRYNQAGEIGRHVARLSQVAFLPDSLRRVKRTRSQIGLSAGARRRNVAGAFQLKEGEGARLLGKVVVLIDDVRTTGATAEACARVLAAHGVQAVHVLSVARVVPGEEEIISSK